MRSAVRRQGHEDDVFLTAFGNFSTGGDSSGIGKKDDLQQDAGIVGRCTGFIVLKTAIENRQIKFIVDQVVERILEGAFLDLLLKKTGMNCPWAYEYGLYLATGIPPYQRLSGLFPKISIYYTRIWPIFLCFFTFFYRLNV
jgi:hypothetical protein